MDTISDKMISKKPAAGVRMLLVSFDKLSVYEQAALLTLPLLLLYADDHWYVKIPVIGLSLAGLIFAGFRRNPLCWFTLVCFMASGIYYNWEAADNHKYLIAYWCFALFLTLLISAGEMALKLSARYLIGLAFLFALVWKVINPDFINGSFFEYTFLFDDRFSGKLKVFGVISPQEMNFNKAAEDALLSYTSRLSEVNVLTNEKIRLLSGFLVWWTLLLEGSIALFFLLPAKNRFAPAGDVFLLLFLLSTYFVAPVIGFGWVIAAMGFIQCCPSRWKIRLSYLIIILLLQVYRLPWASIADSING